MAEREYYIWKAKHQRGLSDEQIAYFLERDPRYELLPYYSLCCKHMDCASAYAEVLNVYGGVRMMNDLKLEEAYLQYDAKEDVMMCWWPDGTGMSLNSSDFFYVWVDGEWKWTKLCWSESKGWYLGAAPEINLQTGEKIKVAVEYLF